MKNLEEFRRTRVLMTKTAYCETYKQDMEQFHKNCYSLYVYADCFYIERLDGGTYNLIIGNQEHEDGSLEQLENLLWHDFAKDEIGESKYHVRLKEILTRYGMGHLSTSDIRLDQIPAAMAPGELIQLVQLTHKINGYENE
jgi:hypothetical protein